MLEDVLRIAQGNSIVAGARVAARLYHRGKLVSTGLAQYKTHPRQAKINALRPYLHAEIDCLLRAARMGFDSWDRAELYVARAKKDGSPGLAKPCPVCQTLIEEFGVGKVYWTDKT